CYVPPRTFAQLAVNQNARLLNVEGMPQGKVVFLAVQAQAETGNFAVKLRFPNPDLRLKANMVMRAEVQTQPEQKRLTIRDTALMEDQDPPGVVVVEEVKTEKDKKIGEAKVLRAII